MIIMVPIRKPASPVVREHPSGHDARAKRTCLVLAALAFAVLSAAPLAGQSAIEILEQAGARHEALEGFCADFEQTIEVTLLRESVQSHGELCQARSDRFDMSFVDPPGDRIVADGMDLWVYYPSTDDGQAFRTRLSGSEGRFDLHREFLSEPGQRYDAELEGVEEVGGVVAHVLSLEPRGPSPYLHARVWIDREEHLIRKLVILEESESVRTVELSNITLNPELSQERFSFVPPPGVQVIRR